MLAACGGGGGGGGDATGAQPATTNNNGGTPATGGTGSTGSSTGGSPAPASQGATPPATTGNQNTPPSTSVPPAAGNSGGGTTGGTNTGGTNTGGSATGGTVSADATQARFRQPLGIARDSAGNLYVADAGNYTIRKIATTGVVTTLAGSAGASGSSDGTGSAARFSALRSIAVDSAGNIYAVDNNAVRKVSPAGVVTTLAGVAAEPGDADGTGGAARFRQPWGIAVDAAGNAYVADTENAVVRRITPAGVVSTVAGTRGMRGRADGSAATATFLGPMGIAVDAAGNLFLTDWYGPPAPNIPEGSTFIRRIGADGGVSTIAGTLNGETGPAAFMDTFALTTDGSGNVFVAAMRSVRRVSATGTITTVAGPATQFQSLAGIIIDAAGNLYVTDASSHTVSRVSPTGGITTVAGRTEEAGSADVP
ncbi:MAG TPA: hypothetical protein VEC01_02390 [Noviherbaspirillum sp.]|uniref:hypothetical protein n=1 Tax=Noviherbaspirillum sp. TaxID=1926288 RepID=UPI002D58DC5D|nr:hypothetical protein [Noviherbaspirillum sp.]HYD94148.1 hypothetical protein [Noviherbaspirillum sp.]